jgi:hypothetical protein
LKLKLPNEPFDHLLLLERLGKYNDPNGKISRMIGQGDLLSLKKGLYVTADANINSFSIANLLYSPSYISMESALSYWGLIPEKVINMTSITNKRKKEFKNGFGHFYYNSIKSKSLHLGIVYDSASKFFIADQTKALCDYIKVRRVVYSDVMSFLEHDLRIDRDDIATLDRKLIIKLGVDYKSKAIRKLYRQIKNL